ncbi:discoidin domain-containing protein [Streptomyces sp. NPDC101393]|uniref:alpha-L-rhamnosidase-related protein n=1 Tax=Streptomyces sp. NPDC101393 TaxID=3366141 RepID=UPI0037F76EE6
MRIVRSAGDVQRPDALLKPGGKVTVLRRDQPPAAPRWPEGSTAEASSTHPGNTGNDGSPRTYEAKHAVDGDLGTLWNDDTEHDFPDTLTLTTPDERELSGVTVVSSTDGVPTAFTVAVRAGAAWRTVATVTGNHAVQRAVRFDAPVSTNRVRISVTAVQDLGRGVFTRINEVWPEAVDPVAAPSVTLDFGKVVVGYPKVDFAWASDNRPGVRLAFSETLQHLTERSDFTRADQAGGAGQGTDQYAVPAGGASWTDQKGYGSGGDKVYADGLHGFRYLKITLDALPSDAPAAQPCGTVAIDAVALDFTAYVGPPDSYRGWFLCSDEELNRYWYGASYTNELVVDTFRKDDVDPRDAFSASLDGKLVLHDGPKRDRDPYVGDVAVSGRTLYLTHDEVAEAARNVLADLAEHQQDNGWIPPASINNCTLPLFDYPLWWVTCSWDYLLYTGDRDYAARYHPQLVKVLDTWYPSVTDEAGLLSKGLNGTADYGDYAFLGRTGRVTYDNATYVQALGDAAASRTTWGMARTPGVGRTGPRGSPRPSTPTCGTNPRAPSSTRRPARSGTPRTATPSPSPRASPTRNARRRHWPISTGPPNAGTATPSWTTTRSSEAPPSACTPSPPTRSSWRASRPVWPTRRSIRSNAPTGGWPAMTPASPSGKASARTTRCTRTATRAWRTAGPPASCPRSPTNCSARSRHRPGTPPGPCVRIPVR